MPTSYPVPTLASARRKPERWCTTRTAAIGFIGLLGVLCAGQELPPTFRAGTRLVEVTVSVFDRKGSPVTGLDPKDFTILDGGEPRPVTFFRYEGTPEPAAAPTAPGPGVFSNITGASGSTPRNVTALLFDSLNTPPEANTQVTRQVLQYLKTLPPDSRIALFHLGAWLRTLHDFTDDAAALRALIERAKFGNPLEAVLDDTFDTGVPGVIDMTVARNELNTTLLKNRVDRTLDALDALGRHLAGIPGRKNVVWFTAGFPIVQLAPAASLQNPAAETLDFEDRLRETARRLAQTGLTLYIVDTHRLEAPRDQLDTPRLQLPRTGMTAVTPVGPAPDVISAMNLMSSVTGGRYFFNTNDLTTGLKQAPADLRGSYTLGFHAPESADGAWRELAIKVARQGVTVRHRQGYFAESGAAESPEWTAETWRAALRNPVASTALPLEVTCKRTDGDEFLLGIRVDKAVFHSHEGTGPQRADLQLMIAGLARDELARTTLVDVSAELPQNGAAKSVPIEQRWKPDPAATSIRVIVRDKVTGQYGTVDVPLSKVPQSVASALEPTARGPSPSWDSFIGRAAEAADEYIRGLPDYICRQRTFRSSSRNAGLSWSNGDTIELELVYEGGRENYRKTTGAAVSPDTDTLGGAWSSGEFATALIDLFDPASAAEFHFQKTSRVGKLDARVYAFEIMQENSSWSVRIDSLAFAPAFRGTAWFEAATGRLLRLERETTNFPRDFPVVSLQSAVEYGYVRLGGDQMHLLPLEAENKGCRRDRVCFRNTVQFRNYRKFESESTIRYGDEK